jgi:hypothetical protein
MNMQTSLQPLIATSTAKLRGVRTATTHSCSATAKMRDFLMRDKRSERSGVELPDILAGDYLPSGFTRAWDLPTWEKEWQGRDG